MSGEQTLKSSGHDAAPDLYSKENIASCKEEAHDTDHTNGHKKRDGNSQRKDSHSPDTDSELDDFEVKWDGEGDRDSPLSMSKARKWIPVLVVSAGSFCVYGIFHSPTCPYDATRES